MNNNFEWRKNDYFWVIGILIGIIFVVCTIRLSDNSDVVNIISLIASFSSICLAVMAIWQSSVNNRSSNNIYNKIIEKVDGIGSTTNELNEHLEEVKKLVVEVGKDSVESLGLPDNETKKMKDQLEESINNDFDYFINDNSSKSNTNKFICKKSEKDLIEIVGNSINDNSLKINMKDDRAYDLFFEDTKRAYFIILKRRVGYATSSNYIFMQNELTRFKKNSGSNNINDKNTVVVILLFTEKKCNVTISINKTKIRKVYYLSEFMGKNIKSEIIELADKIENNGMPSI